MLFQALLDSTGRHTIKFKETMTTFHKIFLLIVKERKHSQFHQMSLKSVDYMLWFSYIHKTRGTAYLILFTSF